MAADTATKRFSAIDMGSPWRSVLPLPDGSVDAGDRVIGLDYYSGITPSVTVAERLRGRLIGAGFSQMIIGSG